MHAFGSIVVYVKPLDWVIGAKNRSIYIGID